MLTASAPTIPDCESVAALPELPFGDKVPLAVEILDSPTMPRPVALRLPTHADPATPAELLDTPDGFLRWLGARPGAEEIGMACSAMTCPLAEYLEANGLYTSVGTDYLYWLVDGQEHQHQLPAWAMRFVRLVDHTGVVSVRAAHAVALVHQAVRETAR